MPHDSMNPSRLNTYNCSIMLVDMATARISWPYGSVSKEILVVYLFGRDTTVSRRAMTAEQPQQDPFIWMKLSVRFPNTNASMYSSNSTSWNDVDVHTHWLAAELVHEEFG